MSGNDAEWAAVVVASIAAGVAIWQARVAKTEATKAAAAQDRTADAQEQIAARIAELGYRRDWVKAWRLTVDEEHVALANLTGAPVTGLRVDHGSSASDLNFVVDATIELDRAVQFKIPVGHGRPRSLHLTWNGGPKEGVWLQVVDQPVIRPF